jgi:hypothetical protein
VIFHVTSLVSEYLFEDAAQLGDRVLGQRLAPPTDVLIRPHQYGAAIPHLARACPVACKVLPGLPRPDKVSFDVNVEFLAYGFRCGDPGFATDAG